MQSRFFPSRLWLFASHKSRFYNKFNPETQSRHPNHARWGYRYTPHSMRRADWPPQFYVMWALLVLYFAKRFLTKVCFLVVNVIIVPSSRLLFTSFAQAGFKTCSPQNHGVVTSQRAWAPLMGHWQRHQSGVFTTLSITSGYHVSFQIRWTTSLVVAES